MKALLTAPGAGAPKLLHPSATGIKINFLTFARHQRTHVRSLPREHDSTQPAQLFQHEIQLNPPSTSSVAEHDGDALAAGKTPEWQELLSTPEPEMFGARARSASDAAVLRRKGHLKEQDRFIQFILDMHHTHTSLEAMQKVEKWIDDHRRDPRASRLRRMVPTLGSFFTPLRLVNAFLEYDEFFALSRRQYVPPNFAEMRHILNIAQLHASSETLRLVTFDADGTLYADGAHMQHDNAMISMIIKLMRSNVHVAIVTAAGYPGAPERFEQRVEGLLAAFKALNLPQNVTDRFHIMGGECNYLLRVAGPDRRLEFVPDKEWKSPFMMSWTETDIKELLHDAETLLLEGASRLRLPVTVMRKQRAVGVIPTVPTIYEVLEDLAITVQSRLDSKLPFCAFNGGNDVFVDVGNKSLGIWTLQKYLGFTPAEVLHVGDRFTESGNDSATRDCCSILWVANPEETFFFVNLILNDISKYRQNPYIE
ncbi:putative IMP-specific 5'-nucleotidase 1 [Nannochloris sp. 'desiccata']|nr:putative IMP-specific 5'-nucleotidase 1 [Chlorella desiccata (nom. nud.)]